MRKLFKHIGMICLAFAVAVGSFFVPIRKPNQSLMASAISNDSSELGYQFSGSEILFFETLVYTPNSSERIAFARFISFDLEIITTLIDGTSIAFNATHYSYNGTSLYENIPYYPQDPLTSEVNRFITRPNFNDGFSLNLVRTDSVYEYLPLYIHTDDGFIANCKAVNISVSPIGTYLGNNINFTSSNFSSAVINIKYIDFNDNALTIQIISPTYFTDTYDDRTYYFLNNFTDNDYYNQGLLDGLAQNQQSIYNNGYSAGFDVGFASGKREGTAEANDYSFISLFGALFDAPITMLMGLLDFDFLGINLWAFLTSLLTLGLVLFVVKLIIGR